MSARSAAAASLLLALPIGLLVSAIVFNIQPLEMLLKSVLTSDGSQPNAVGFVVMIGGLLALPPALLISLWPLFRQRRLYALNLAVAAAILVLMVSTWGGLAADIYRCDVLRIPNCD